MATGTAIYPSEAYQKSITTLYESDRVLVIDKPPGIAHHCSHRIADGDEADDSQASLGILAVLRAEQAAGRLQYQGRLYGVHRLDKVTSGVLAFAKDQQMSQVLAGAFRSGNVIKYYTGLSMAKAKKKQGWVKGRMVRGRRKSWYLTRDRGDGSSFAVTRYFTSGLGTVNRFDATDPEVKAGPSPTTLILFRPHTGRTHQLRVAAKSVGMPLAGDPLYSDNLQHAMDRTYLHATALRIPDINLAVVSLPPFGSLWSPSGRDAFLQYLTNIVDKHCDDEILCNLMKQQTLVSDTDGAAA
jgi:tRNA pseudouridine32 synthase / 23S rRNA pseudouridine746 synthase